MIHKIHFETTITFCKTSLNEISLRLVYSAKKDLFLKRTKYLQNINDEQNDFCDYITLKISKKMHYHLQSLIYIVISDFS